MSREMKDSGVEWIGEIPKDWKVKKLKRIGKFSSSGIDKKINENEVPVKIVNYVDVYRDIKHELFNSDEYMVVTTTQEKIDKHCLKKGDLVFTPSSETIEDIGISSLVREDLDNTAFSYHLLRFEFNIDIYENYKKYLCNNYYVRNYYSKCATGTIRKTLNRNDFELTEVLLPPFLEQQKIANFLDEKVGEIDRLIDNAKKSIEEYKKYKQSVITEAVTKGLDPNVEMKDSGIEWIGEIPKHWEINIINQIFLNLKNKNINLQEKNLLSLSYGKIIRKNIKDNTGLLPENFTGYNIIEKNDIVLRLTDLQNDHKSLRVGRAEERGIITSAYITLRPRKNIDTRYYYRFLHTFDVYKGFYGMGSGVRQGLNFDELKYLKIVNPPVYEQNKIANYLDLKCNEIDNLISKKEQLISELESYKKSIIYEYVTGKKEV